MKLNYADGICTSPIEHTFYKTYPVKDFMKIDLQQPAQVQAFNLTGCRRIDAEVVNHPNVSILTSGLYILQLTGRYREDLLKNK